VSISVFSFVNVSAVYGGRQDLRWESKVYLTIGHAAWSIIASGTYGGSSGRFSSGGYLRDSCTVCLDQGRRRDTDESLVSLWRLMFYCLYGLCALSSRYSAACVCSTVPVIVLCGLVIDPRGIPSKSHRIVILQKGVVVDS
jgi:hypothetical protein